jgi:2-amino-4-hydroxy-6-hydroxymethyldihydropteridine diphosphokinase
MAKVILSLGSSIGNRKKTLIAAIDDLNSQTGKILSVSSFYETEPWGFTDKNLFLNLAVIIQTNLSPQELLKNINSIENKHGRIRNKKTYQARTLDIDIIFYDNIIHYEKNLQIPHKYAHKRKFVLLPIAEIAPNFVHPVLQQKIIDLLKNVEDSSKIYIFNEK